MKSIEAYLDVKSYNLNFMKFVASILVIFSHSFILSGESKDPLAAITNSQLSFGALAVTLFFFASGLYVTKGLVKRRKGSLYFKNRFMRIYPAFIVVIFATVFILGPIVSRDTVIVYFRNSDTYKYLLYLFMIPKYKLPGVFLNNPYKEIVNGSLWTLILETICYIGLYLVYRCGCLNKKILKKLNILFGFGVFFFFGLKIGGIYQYNSYLRPLMIFIMGTEFYVFKDTIQLGKKKTYIVIMLTVILFLINLGDVAAIFCFPYLFASIIFAKRQVNIHLAKLGNYSYAIYLVAFPIQQICIQYIKNSTPYINTIVSSIVSIVFAIIIYHCIEIPIGKLTVKK